MRSAFVVLCLLAVSVCMGQYLEATIPLADSLMTSYVWSMFYNPGSNTVWVGEDSTVVFDAATGRKLELIPWGYYASCYNPASDKFYLASDSLYVLDASSHERIAAIAMEVQQSEGRERVLAFDSVGNKLYCPMHRQDSVAVVCGAGDTLIRKIWVDGAPAVLEFNQTERKLYCLSRFHGVTVVDATVDTFLAYVSAYSASYDPLEWSSRSNKLYVGTPSGLTVIDGVTNAIVKQIPHVNDVQHLAYNPVNDRVYGKSNMGQILSVDCSIDTIAAEINEQGFEELSLYCSPVANKVYVSDWESRIAVIDCSADTVQTMLWTGAQDSRTPMCHSPQDNRVFVAGVWNVSVIDGVMNSMETVVITNRYDPRDICYSPARDRMYCLSSGVGGLTVVDCASNTHLGTKVVGVQLDRLLGTPGGEKLYMTDNSRRSILVASTATESLVGEIGGNGIYLSSPMRLDAAANKLLCLGGPPAARDGFGTIVDVSADTILAYVQTAGRPDVLELSPRSHRAYFGGLDSTCLTVVDTEGDSVFGYIDLGWPIRMLGYGPASDCVYAFNDSGDMAVVDCSTDSVVSWQRVPSPQWHQEPAWCPSTNRLYYPSGREALAIVDCEVGVYDTILFLGDRPEVRAFDTLANKVYCEVWRDTVCILDMVTDSVLGYLELDHLAGRMAWAPTHRRTYVCGGTSTITVLKDTVTGIGERTSEVGGRRPGPTVVRGVLRLPRSLDPSRCDEGAGAVGRHTPWTLFSITGRRVMDLVPGSNDVRHISPGVYFIRPAGTAPAGQGAVPIRAKVVIAR